MNKHLENILIELALESLDIGNFSNTFKVNGNKCYKPNIKCFSNNTRNNRDDLIFYLKSGPLVLIDISKKGCDFTIYTKDDNGNILEYRYYNMGGEEFEIRLYVYSDSYYQYDTTPENSFLRKWNSSMLITSIKRMNKLEEIINMMVSDQEVDKESINKKILKNIIGLSPKRSKRQSILKKILEN